MPCASRRCVLQRTLPATLEAVEAFLIEFKRSACPPGTAERFAAELLLREALTNAVVHGCRSAAGKQVRCAIRFKQGDLLIRVEDDGDGFDWRSAQRSRAAAAECSGRGLEILRSYATRVRFNDKGNVVIILKRSQKGNPQ
jgi:anti-sigma regulatory factor (Ser/Thr protein kinase)